MISEYLLGADRLTFDLMSFGFISLSAICFAIVVACICRLNRIHFKSMRFYQRAFGYNACLATSLWIFCDMIHGAVTYRDIAVLCAIAVYLLTTSIPSKSRHVTRSKTTCNNHATA